MTTKTETMEDLTKYFIDLSKCTEKHRKHIFSLLPEPRTPVLFEIEDDCSILCYRYIIPHGYEWIACVDSFKDGRTELTYPEFIKLFEGGEGENQTFTKEDIEKAYNQFLETFGNKD